MCCCVRLFACSTKPSWRRPYRKRESCRAGCAGRRVSSVCASLLRRTSGRLRLKPMTPNQPFPLVAVDIGNSRTKLGLFQSSVAVGLPVPVSALSLDGWDAQQVEAWLKQGDPQQASVLPWRISSVNRPMAANVLQWLGQRPDTDFRQLTVADLPLVVAVDRPDLVGMDRLVNAIAANRLKSAGRPAIVISVGMRSRWTWFRPTAHFKAAPSCRALPCRPARFMTTRICCR